MNVIGKEIRLYMNITLSGNLVNTDAHFLKENEGFFYFLSCQP